MDRPRVLAQTRRALGLDQEVKRWGAVPAGSKRHLLSHNGNGENKLNATLNLEVPSL